MQEESAKSLDTCVWFLNIEVPETGDTDLANPSDVFISRFFVETQILIQTESDIVAIETIHKFVKM